jgi:pimeloyl-ACP methyl ester carboxylesterase
MAPEPIPSQRTHVRARDGRQLEVLVAGEPERGTIIVHHGTPSSAELFCPLVATGAERGLRHVAYSRPGYGHSDRHAGRTVADCVPDVEAIADSLGIERFYTSGGSGGGPHALACAALLPERVIAAASIAGVAPRHAEGLDWSAGMGQENLDEFAAADAGEEPLRIYLLGEASALLNTTGEQLYTALGDLLSDVDRAVLTGEYAEHLSSSVRGALAPGVDGWLDDDLAFMRDWGFDVGSLRVPVSIWQGRQDRFVPPTHGEWLGGHAAGAKVHLRDSDGHLSLALGAYGEVLDELLQ